MHTEIPYNIIKKCKFLKPLLHSVVYEGAMKGNFNTYYCLNDECGMYPVNSEVLHITQKTVWIPEHMTNLDILVLKHVTNLEILNS